MKGQLGNIGTAYSNIGQVEKAIEYFEDAYNRRRDQKSKNIEVKRA